MAYDFPRWKAVIMDTPAPATVRFGRARPRADAVSLAGMGACLLGAGLYPVQAVAAYAMIVVGLAGMIIAAPLRARAAAVP